MIVFQAGNKQKLVTRATVSNLNSIQQNNPSYVEIVPLPILTAYLFFIFVSIRLSFRWIAEDLLSTYIIANFSELVKPFLI